jgi:SAM-dependent methyltransferase
VNARTPDLDILRRNLARFRDDRTVSSYADYQRLEPCEEHIFARYLQPGMRILDLGVGCGRTSTALASGAASYIGVDYSPEMIEVCEQRYPSLEFRVSDAADLAAFSAAAFDLVVFSFNGLDYLTPDQARHSCIQEVDRVLDSAGLFIFSVHNARCIFPRPDKQTAGIRAAHIAPRLFPRWPRAQRICSNLGTIVILAASRISLTYGSILHKLSAGSFWHGDGYFFDPVHGGLRTRAATPRRVVSEMEDFKFNSLEIVGSEFPQKDSTFTTGWFYYVFRKRP